MRLNQVIDYLSDGIIYEMATEHFEQDNVIKAINAGEIDEAIQLYIENAEKKGKTVVGSKAKPSITIKSIRGKIAAGKIKVDPDKFEEFAEKLIELHAKSKTPKKTTKKVKEEKTEE